MLTRKWWREALSKADNVSTTRICFLFANVFVFVCTILLLILDRFTLDWAWFLLGIFTTAWGGKDVAKYMEVRRELNKNSYSGSGVSRPNSGNPMAKGSNKRP